MTGVSGLAWPSAQQLQALSPKHAVPGEAEQQQQQQRGVVQNTALQQPASGVPCSPPAVACHTPAVHHCTPAPALNTTHLVGPKDLILSC